MQISSADLGRLAARMKVGLTHEISPALPALPALPASTWDTGDDVLCSWDGANGGGAPEAAYHTGQPVNVTPSTTPEIIPASQYWAISTSSTTNYY